MKNKKTILHLISGLEIGGAEIMLLQILPLLTDFNHIVCSLSSAGSVGKKIEALGIPVHTLETGRRFSPAAILKFKKIVKEQKPDILSTRLIHADIFGRVFGKLFGIKKIHCHLESILDQPKYDKFFLLEQLTSTLVTKYTAVSQSVKNKYINKAKINPSRIEVIYNGIDLNKFQNLPDKITAKKMLGFNESDLLIGYAAKMRPERNHATLIKSVALITTKAPNIKLVLAGDGPEKENLIQLAKKLNISDKVVFLGNREDVPQILTGLDIFVSPSAYEGMSVAILEAMAAGLPIIASDIEPNRELIKNGTDGFLVAITPELIAEKIIWLMANPEIKLMFSQKTKEKSCDFSIIKTAAGMSDVLNSL